MAITYSIALFPELAPLNDKQMERAITYARLLKKCGGKRIVIRSRLPRFSECVKMLCDSLHEEGLGVVMYSGVWGGVDLTTNATFRKWAQRDQNNNPLGYCGSLKSGMLCPASPYVNTVLAPELREMLSLARPAAKRYRTHVRAYFG